MKKCPGNDARGKIQSSHVIFSKVFNINGLCTEMQTECDVN